MDLHLPRTADCYGHFRRLVEEGVEDQPVRVFYDGRHCLTAASLHRAALFTVAENPSVHRVPWTPHPAAPIGPRMAALLERRAAERTARVGAGGRHD